MASVILPRIGVTINALSMELIERYPDKIVGSFWVMNGYGFDPDQVPQKTIPGSWIDLVREDNPAQAIIDYVKGNKMRGHPGLLSLGYCIVVVAGTENPADLSFVIDHVKLSREGMKILEPLARYNIPACTEVLYPESYASTRAEVPRDMKKWTVHTWEDYCAQLMAQHGAGMLINFWDKDK